MSDSQSLLSEIEAFCRARGVAASTLCRKAVGNSKLPIRLRAGGDVTTETARKIRQFMADWPSDATAA